VFGLRGEAGDLVIEPKLVPAQFDRKGEAVVGLDFAGARLRVRFHNIGKRAYEAWRIGAVKSAGQDIPTLRREEKKVIVARATLAKQKSWDIDVELS
jgi:hypothetical protein